MRGCACIAHALQAVTDADPKATILSVDGISAYDSLSRVAMMRGLRQMERGDALLPFVNQFCGGETMKGLFTKCFKEQGENKGTHSCQPCSL